MQQSNTQYIKRLIKLPLEKCRFYLNVFSNKTGEVMNLELGSQ